MPKPPILASTPWGVRLSNFFGKRAIARGNAARRRRDWKAASTHYRDYLDRRPDNFAIWVQLGHALKELGRLDESLEAYESALHLNRAEASDLFLNLGHLYKLKLDLDGAIHFYKLSVERTGNSAAREELLRLGHEPEPRHIDAPPVEEVRSDQDVNLSPVPEERNYGIIGSLDFFQGNIAVGWVWNPDAPNVPASVDFFVEGQLVHTAEAKLFREDVKEAGFGSGYAGFYTTLPIAIEGEGVVVHALLAGTQAPLSNSPRLARPSREITRWLNRSERINGRLRTKLGARLNRETRGLMSIVMPVYNTDPEWLAESIDSVIGQWCARWELICVNDASTMPHVQRILDQYAWADSRIKIVNLKSNSGIAAATNAGIRVAKGDIVSFMDHDDYLEPDAVFKYLSVFNKFRSDMIYCDELIALSEVSAIIQERARPAFSWDFYISHPYFVHMICVSRALLDKVEAWNEGMRISADIDFVLRCLEEARSVCHIPAMLYRWRTHAVSEGHEKKTEVTQATLGALNKHLAKVFPGAVARAGSSFNRYRVDFSDDHGDVLIVIPTKNGFDLLKPCINSIIATTKSSEVHIMVIDHESDEPALIEYLDSIRDQVTVFPFKGKFNYAKMNNAAVRAYKRKHKALPAYVAFLNNDIEAIEPGWLEHMRGLAGRRDVGAVGATLLYSNRTIQHSGVVIGLNGVADHAHKFVPFQMPSGELSPGYNESLTSTRDYSAVTAACIMSRSSVFLEVNGFDERLVVGFNDTDYCLRVGARGYKIINDAHAVLYHHESATRKKTKHMLHPKDGDLFLERWDEIIRGGDPYYSPLLAIRGVDHQIERYAAAAYQPRVRPGLGNPIFFGPHAG